MEHAPDAVFQAWVQANDLQGLVDDNGIAGWSFDDRCRLINFALRQGKEFRFAEETIPPEEQKPENNLIVLEFLGATRTPPEAG